MFGGFNDDIPIATAERYKLGSYNWEIIAPLYVPKAYMTAIIYNTDLLYLIGGYTVDKLNKVNRY